MRAVLALPVVLALAAGSLAFADPEAAPHCTVVRGAETADTSDDVEACRSDVWFHDNGTKVDNLDHAAATGYATWDETPPASSVTAGGGAGALGTSALHQQSMPFDDRESFVAEGRVEGALDSVAVELYFFPLRDMAANEFPYDLDAQLLVDGEEIAALGGAIIESEVAGSAVRKIRFAFTGLTDTIENYHGFGLVGPVGGGHDVRLTVHGTGIASDAAVWVYDATEAPSNMVINPPADLLAELG